MTRPTKAAKERVFRAAMEYYRWLLKRDFKSGDFIGAKGRWFDACAAARRKR